MSEWFNRTYDAGSKNAITVLCPRCQRERFTPYDDTVEATREQIQEFPYPALSRVANIHICTHCGADEAMRDHFNHPPIPPDEWPV